MGTHYYVVITSLLPRHVYILLRRYYVTITSLLRHYYKARNYVIMSSLLSIITFAVSIKIPLLPAITIIAYYYVFETCRCLILRDFK